MRVLHLSSEYPPARVYGLGRYVRELAETQAAAGHYVEVITNSLGSDEYQSTQNGVNVKRTATPPPPKAPTSSGMLLHFQSQVIERAAEFRFEGEACTYDVINAHDWLTVTAGFHLARLFKAPLVTTIHDVIFNKARHREFTVEDEYVAGVENWACHISNRVIVLSEAVRQELLTAYHALPERVVVVRGGVAIQPFDSSDFAEVRAWREKLAGPKDDLLLYAGRLDGEKGIPILLEAARRLRGIRPSGWKLAVAGTGTFEQLIDDFVRKNSLHNCVARLGYLPLEELRVAYAAADVHIVPSEYEPFGLVALEAQRMGTPVILSDTGGLSEIIQQTGGGLSFRAGDAAELCARIDDLLGDTQLRIELGRRAQVNTAKFYDWPTLAAQIEQIYAGVANRTIDYMSFPPEWSRPGQSAIPQARAPQPLRNVVVFWKKADLANLKPILERLSHSHVFDALDGNILVAPLSSAPNDETQWGIPFQHPRVSYIQPNDPAALWSEAACLVTQSELADSLHAGGIVDSAHIPTVWCGAKPERSGIETESVDVLFAWVIKLLCDERFRRSAAPKLAHSIPQLQPKAEFGTKLKILHVVPQIVTGGAETVLLDLVKQTAAQYSHAILCLGPCEGPLPDELKAAHAGIVQLEKASTDELLNSIVQLNPDVLHLHSMSYIPRWISVHRRLGGFKIIESEHVVDIGSGHFGPVDVVACVSKAVKGAHAKYESIWGESSSKFEVIYNGLDLSLYESLPTKKEARKRLALPYDRPIIGRVSALARNKLPPESLQAIPLILKRRPDALFVIVGDGEQRAPAEAWVRQNGLQDSVRFLGERRDIPQILPAFDVFAYYTTKEALGNVILEAIAAGVPVVTTDVEGTSEALRDAPGSLVPLGAIVEFADAVCAELDNKAKRGKRGAFRLSSRFDRREMGKAYEVLYQRLADDARRSSQIASESLPPPGGPVDLLIKFPTRNRPRQFFDVLSRYVRMLSGKHSYRVVVTCDIDDFTMNNIDVRTRLAQIPNVKVHFGPHRNKVEAINAGMANHVDFKVLLLASDDMLPVVPGYDEVVLSQMNRHFPDGDGVLFFNDGYRRQQINTLPIFGKRYFDRFGYIYNPEYESLWCDNEFTAVANLLERQVYFDEPIIRHEHPANVGCERDPLYLRNDEPIKKDEQTFRRRREQHFKSEATTAVDCAAVLTESAPTAGSPANGECVINVGMGGWYPLGQQRLRESLLGYGYQGALIFSDNSPPGAPEHSKIPYAFKPFAFDHARKQGHKLVLWCDAAVWAVKSVSALFDELRANKYLLFKNEGSLGQWCSDAALTTLGLSREDTFKHPILMACCMGLNFEDETCNKFLDEWLALANDGVTFPGAWTNEQNEVSADKRVLGHRHDQTAASAVAWRLGMQRWLDAPSTHLHYLISGKPISASVVLLSDKGYSPM